MPFDANGNFSLVPGTIVADGMNVLPSQHNPPFQDVANGLSQSVVRDGRAPMTGPLNMNGNKITGVAAGDAPDDVVTNAAIADLGVAIGDGKWSVRDLSPNWLRRDGSLYLRADYPDLADLLPPLPDGVSWSNISSGVSGTPTGLVITGDGYFVASRSGNDTTIWKSPDGGAYSLVATVANISVYSFAYENGVYIISGVGADSVGKVAVSTDASVWSSPVSPGIGTTVFECAYNGTLYCAVGNGGNIATSPDLVSWTSRTSGVSVGLRSVRVLNGVFVATGLSGAIVTSPTGETWTSRTSGTAENIFSSTWTGSLYVVVGTGGFIGTSPDLSAWTGRTSGTSLTLNDVVHSSAGLVAVGASGVARISSAGTTWSATTTGVSSNLDAISVNPNAPHEYFVLGGGSFLKGVRTLPTQFRVPTGPEPLYDWIRAL